MFKIFTLTALIISGLLLMGCESDDNNDVTDPDTDNNLELPDIYAQFDSQLNIYTEGNFVVIESSNVPDHPSPYFNSNDNRYEAYNGSNANFNLNPNSITEQTMVYKIPINPTEANNHASTPLGAMGISINGVAIFNQYAGPNNQALTNEINSFDQYAGHPQNSGVYHYHIEPTFLTQESYQGRSGFIGVLLDGFPVYGPIENGSTITNSDLDEFHGHISVTADFPEGIYHYHITDADPYINGNGFYGTAGTVSN